MNFCLRPSLRGTVALLLLLSTAAFAQKFQQNNWAVSGHAIEIVRGEFSSTGLYSTVSINDDGTVTTLTSNGDVLFNRADSPGVAGATHLVAGDFNRDGKLDIAVIAQFADQTRNLAVLLGNGDFNGTFQSPLYTSGDPKPVALAVADFNGDGQLDVAVGTSAQGIDGQVHNTITVRFGNGAGGFGDAVTTNDVGHKPDTSKGESGFELHNIVAADFNGDGKADIALMTEGWAAGGDVESGSVDILLGNGAGGFTAGSDILIPAIDLELADVNQDAKPDLLVPYSGCLTPCQGLKVFQNNGDATFTVIQTPFESADYAVFSAEAVDLNNDGRKDLIVSSDGQFEAGVPTLAWSYKQPDDTYGPVESQQATSAAGAPYFRSLVQGDLFPDGRMDVAEITGDGKVAMFENNDSTAPGCQWNFGQQQAVYVCSPQPQAKSPVYFLAFPEPLGNPVTGMKVYVDGVSRFATADDHISKAIAIANGTHRVTVKAWNVFGPYSKTFTLTVSSTACPIPTTQHTVTICSPTSGSTVSSPVHISAGINNGADTNSGAYGISAVKIYIDGVSKYVFGPGTRQVDVSATMSAGSHRVTVRAWDGATSWSKSVTFTVK